MQISRHSSKYSSGRISKPISARASKRGIRRSDPAKSRRREPDGFIITLVAIFLLFVVGAMAALSIDVVTFYTARSEAQLAADSGALAGARVLANSGATSDSNALTDNTLSGAQTFASAAAMQVAENNSVGGQPLKQGNINVAFNGNGGSPCPQPQQVSNPCVTVQITTVVPVFFARIWGNTQVTISASATAEAFNPSGLATSVSNSQGVPVAPSCVKPWLLPNLDPSTTGPIFNTLTGMIANSALLGWETPMAPTGTPLFELACPRGNCTPIPPAAAWAYLPADTTDSFPPPPSSSVTCSGSSGFSAYQLSVAGCVQIPIACNNNTTVNIDMSDTRFRNSETASAVNCMAHTSKSGGDQVDKSNPPYYPFEFLAGADNPLVEAGVLSSGKDVWVSDSLVTVPVIDSTTWPPSQPVQIIGFVQLFISPEGQQTTFNGKMHTMVTNLVGCGTNSNATPTVYGNGATAVPVRLVSPP
jgi:putative Flp pilus-assembly TadE/G-like protein